MLPEERRQQLDGIVQKMIQNKESDATIQFVVNDFKTKYDQREPQPADNRSTYDAHRGAPQKVAGFLGIERAGQGLAAVHDYGNPGQERAGNESVQSYNDTQKLIDAAHKFPPGSPERNRIADFLKRGMSDPGYISQEEVDPGTALSNKEVAGSFGNVALNTLTPGAFKGGLGAQVAKNAALGAGYGLAGGLNDNKSGSDLGYSTLTGSIVGAAIPVAGKIINKTKQVITQKLPENLMNRAIKPTLDELRRNVKFGADTLGKQLLQEKVKGSPQKLLQIADTNLNKYETQLQTVLKGSKATVSRNELTKYLDDVLTNTQNTPGLANQVKKIKGVLAEFPEQVSLVQANQIKRNIYNEIRNVGYKLDANLNTKREAMKALATGIKTEIENKVGGTVVKDINQKLSIYGRLEDRVVDLLARNSKNNLFGLTDAILAGGGIAAGSPLGFAAVLAKHAVGSTKGMTTTANILNKGSRVGTGIVGKTIKQATKRTILNAN